MTNENRPTGEYIHELGRLQGQFEATVVSLNTAIKRLDGTNSDIFSLVERVEIRIGEKIDKMCCPKEGVLKAHSESIKTLQLAIVPMEDDKKGVLFTARTAGYIWKGFVAIVFFWLAIKTYELQKQQVSQAPSQTTTTNP